MLIVSKISDNCFVYRCKHCAFKLKLNHFVHASSIKPHTCLPIQTKSNKTAREQLAQREAARAEQEKLTAEECEALRPEGEKLGWDFGMVVRYAAALKKWVKAGRPTRTDEEIEAIEAICKQCEKYEPIEGRCSVCGCKILTPGITIMSKAKLATEKCPKGKW